jgi:hypothetical protein
VSNRPFPRIEVITTQAEGAPATGADTRVLMDGVELKRLVGYQILGRTNDLSRVRLEFFAEVTMVHEPKEE